MKTKRVSFKAVDKDKLYYLASPFSHPRREIEAEREQQISKVAGALIVKHKLKLITPITSSYRLRQLTPELGTSWEFWKHVDETYIKNCDG